MSPRRSTASRDVTVEIDTPQELAAPRARITIHTPVMMRLADLVKATYNPREMNEAERAGLRSSLEEFGLVENLVWNRRSGNLVGGHQRLDELIAAGVEEAPVIVVDLGPAAEKALNITLNNRAIAGRFTAAVVGLLDDIRIELPDLHDALRLGVVAEDIDFSAVELDNSNGVGGSGLLADRGPQVDKAEELQRKWKVELGDMFEIASRTTSRQTHRLLCGDSTNPADVARLMNGQHAAWCWTDPPYNIAYGTRDDHPWRPQRAILNDDLGDKFPEFCRGFVAQIKNSLLPGAMLYLAMSSQEWPVIDATVRAAGFHWSSTIIWKKDRLVLSRKDYHTQFEPIWYGWEDSAPRLCPLEDRTQSDVWEIDRPSRSEDHPTMKPPELVARALMNSSRPGDLGFEPFSGSGTTLAVAEQIGRRCYAMELDPKYVAVALERLTQMGLTPRRVKSPCAVGVS